MTSQNYSPSYTQDPNNFTATDRTNEQKKIDGALRRAKDDSGDETRFVHKKSVVVQSHKLIAPVTDLQVGGGGYEAVRAEIAVKEVSKCCNCELLIGGDSADNGNVDARCKTNVFGNRNRPSESSIILCDLFKDDNIKEKIIAILAGNHDSETGNRNKASDSSISHHVADAMGIDYIPHAMIYGLPILTSDTLEVKYQYYLFIHDAGEVDRAKRLVKLVYNELSIELSGMFIEHLHTGHEGIYTVELPVHDKQGKRLGDKQNDVFIGMGYSFQNGNNIYNTECMFNNTTNLKAYDVSWEKNPYSTKENELFEPKYKAFVNPILVLDKTKNEPSEAIKMYQKKWVLNSKSLESYKTKLNELSLGKLVNKVECLGRDFNSAMSRYVETERKKQQPHQKKPEKVIKTSNDIEKGKE